LMFQHPACCRAAAAPLCVVLQNQQKHAPGRVALSTSLCLMGTQPADMICVPSMVDGILTTGCLPQWLLVHRMRQQREEPLLKAAATLQKCCRVALCSKRVAD
jgi:hypothetical protein